MLEQLRRQGASIFVYLIFCLLILIFIINFRPGQSRQDDNGCRGVSNVVVSVDGTEATQTAYHIAYSNPYNRGTGKQKVYVALETLIRRELLANAAEARGLLATDGLVIDEIKKGHFFLGGQKTMIPGAFEEIDHEKFYSQKAVKSWMGQMNVSSNAYIEEQRRSLLASMMSEILAESVQVSREEALSQFLYEGNTATYDVVAFKPEMYRSAMRATDADVDRYLATHADEVEKRYKADERTYKGVKPQLQLREIFIAKAEAPKPAPAPADDKDKDKDAKSAKPEVKPVGMPIDEAKAKLEAVRAAAATNKQKFIDAAKELSTDEAAKSVGGDVGWHTVDNGMLGEKAVNDALKALKPGDMTPVIATDRGVYLILAEAKREGDLKFDQVKHELAKQLAIDTWSKEAAKRAALAALDQAKGGTLDKLYERELVPAQPQIDFQKIIQNPNLTDEQKQEILQKLLQQHGGDGGEHGALEIESKDVPAGWFAETTEAGSPAAGSAVAPAGSAAPAMGSAAGPPAAPPAPAPVVEDLVPSKDQLPGLGEVAKAHVNRLGPSPRAKQMPGLGQSKAAADAVFDELKPGELAPRIFSADNAYILVQLVSRAQPNVADFDKDADHRVAELRQSRGQAFVEEWLKDKCETLAKDGKIKPNAELILDHDEQGKILPTQYRPCMSFR